MHTFLPLHVGQVSLRNFVFPDPPQFGHLPFPLQVEQTPMEYFPVSRCGLTSSGR
jgi:hypothetical protein